MIPPSTARIPTANLANGTYYWQAHYSGDSTGDTASSSPCGAEVMVFGTSEITDSVSGGGQHGTAITVPANTPVTATATAGVAGKATGYAYYNYYADGSCEHVAPGHGRRGWPCSGGIAGTSQPVTLNAGTYYLQVRYSGDAGDPAATSCGQSTVTVLPPPTPTIAAAASGGGAQGTSISVPVSTPVTVTAQLGGTAVPATGSVEYDFFSDNACTSFVTTGGIAAVNNGTATPSSPVASRRRARTTSS